MQGKIEHVYHYYDRSSYGYIRGEDNNRYYFNANNLSDGFDLGDFPEGDIVSFTPGPFAFEGAAYPTALNVKPQNSSSRPYKPGYSKNLNRNDLMNYTLKPNSGEIEVLDKLSQLLYISYGNKHDMGHNSVFPFCLVGNTSVLKQYIRGRYEFLLVFSHFRSGDWQQNTLKAAQFIRLRKEISERRPMVNFYILVSNARNLVEEINKVKGGTSAAVIPFSFSEILACEDTESLQELLLSRFDEYYFENNMLGEKDHIEEDQLLFGDRGKIADAIVQRCKEGSHSGIFGLRRSGKSSVLKAVERRLAYNQIKYVHIESRSNLEEVDSWKTALYDIARSIRIETLNLKEQDDETRAEFNKKLKLFSTEEDYQKKPTQCFVEDVHRYTKGEEAFVIAIDEIELITYNTATSSMWQNLDSYKGFWGALRDSGCSLVLCGVNSTINEKSIIEFKGMTCDNPMYERVHNCAAFSKNYLPAFTDEQTKVMINTLGSYSNVAFNNVYSEINRAFGGQPYAIRQCCAYMFEQIKSKRSKHEPYDFTKATSEALIEEFCNDAKGVELFKTILLYISIYKDEYKMLKQIALSPEKYRSIAAKDIRLIDHLEKYGIIEYDRRTNYIAFSIKKLQEYLQKTERKNPSDMDNEERRHFVQDNVARCEKKLKKYILNYFTYTTGGTTAGRKVLLKDYGTKYANIAVNPKAKPVPDPNTCKFKDFFDHDLFLLYFSSIKKIIGDNWGTLGNAISDCGISQAKFRSSMEDLNAGRTDADHYDAEDMTAPDEWEIDHSTIRAFELALETMEKIFDACNL